MAVKCLKKLNNKSDKELRAYSALVRAIWPAITNLVSKTFWGWEIIFIAVSCHLMLC
jgi:hypothetical protein